MIKLLLQFTVILTALVLPTALAAREIALRAECFDDRGDGAIVRVYETIRPPRFIGSIVFPNGDYIEKKPLHFREAGVNVIWRGREFFLRVNTNDASIADLNIGRFRGRDEDGNPIILGSLSCDLSGWARSER